ncbi:MAG: alpha-L-glutamate ligase [Alphaproteobacteria bacterium]|nr:MAG: alpha-L-glutamate ligase [Alphaproteobacteria bacterium]
MRQGLNPQDRSPRVYVIHENDEWVVPLRSHFGARGIPFAEWHLDQGILDLRAPPPPGVFYNRMSASSHTRDHRYAPELTSAVLAWLNAHDAVVVNGERALQLELSKVAQYEALGKFGIATPQTLAVVGKDNIAEAARRLGYPVILKHNRAGKGLGVRLLLSAAALDEHLGGREFEESVDGITLVQRYIKAPAPFITRVEFVGGKFLYAVRVDTSQGFELCPADVCQIDPAELATSRPAVAPGDKFQIVRDFDHPLIARWQAFLAANDIAVAGIEFIVDENGRSFTYDVNTNTNYNPDAEAKDGRAGTSSSGMGAIASYLGNLLAQESNAVVAPLAETVPA